MQPETRRFINRCLVGYAVYEILANTEPGRHPVLSLFAFWVVIWIVLTFLDRCVNA